MDINLIQSAVLVLISVVELKQFYNTQNIVSVKILNNNADPVVTLLIVTCCHHRGEVVARVRV